MRILTCELLCINETNRKGFFMQRAGLNVDFLINFCELQIYNVFILL